MKFFISHSSIDHEYGNELVKLLREIEVPKKEIVFTSKEMYGVPGGQNIFEWLKQRLQKEMFVIYLLSDNYYDSIACLNEMGASWVLENKHRTIIIPGFDIDSPNFANGAINPRKKIIFMDEEDSIIEFIESIIKKQGKEVSLNNIKKIIRNFLNAIKKIKQNKPGTVSLKLDDTLGTGWMEKQEVIDIVRWEKENFLNNYLSNNYHTLNGFIPLLLYQSL